MIKIKKILTTVMVMLFTLFTVFSYLPAQAARKPTVVPQVQFANAPVTEYKVGDRVGFNIHSPNYGGRVEYRVVLWNDSKKSYSDLWYPSNGYPTRYYTKWQPYGNNIFTLGWIINEPGSYRITVYAKRVGIPNSQGALKGFNCDSYKESVAFRVRAKEATVQSILPVADITVNQGVVPTLPSTVKAVMKDGTERALKVTWGAVNTTIAGTFIIQGSVEGTTLKASQRLIVNPIQTTLNVYSVTAGSINTVNVNLRGNISFTPELSRFSLSGYGVSYLRLYTLNMSTDRKTIQLSTDTMTLGNWYTLKVDGKEYVFQVPYNIGSENKVTLTARDIVVSVNGSMYPDITLYPSDAELSFIPYNSTIAKYDSYSRKIVGLKAGTTTFYVTATKTGLTSASATFSVTVRGNSSSLSASPTVLNESVANDGSLEPGLITVRSLYEYLDTDIIAIIDNLPKGLSYTVNRENSTTLKIYITGNADNHENRNDTIINVYAFNGNNSGSDYLVSNDVKINFIDATPAADVAAAKALVTEEIYTMAQSAATDEAAVKATIEAKIAALALNGVTATVTKVDYNSAEVGDAGTPAGTNGAYTFTVKLVKGTASDTTETLTMTVIATAYVVPTEVIDRDIISGITAPVKGSTPDLTIGENDEYTGTIVWFPADAKFTGDKVYTATITLIPKTGYTLTGVTQNFFTVPGAMTATNPANSGVVTAVFEPTAPLSNEASLKELKYNGTKVGGFQPDIMDYEVGLPSKTTKIPSISYITKDPLATVSVTDAVHLPGTATIVVTAEDGKTQKIYTIHFTVQEPASTTIVGTAGITHRVLLV